MSACAQQISDLDEMIRLGETFLRMKPIVKELNSIHWKGRREEFQTAHAAHLRAFPAARRVLKERYGITCAKEITIQEWKKEKAQLMRGRERLYGQHAPLQDELVQLLMVKHCTEIITKGKQSRERHETLEIIQ